MAAVLMFVFGAGASYDALPDFPPPPVSPTTPEQVEANMRRLPLAHELLGLRFADDLARFREATAIAPYLRRLPDGLSFEQRLEELANEGEADEERACQMLAVRYYLQLMVSGADNKWVQMGRGVTNYRTLFDEARRLRPNEPILIVTFNYDRMIEHSLAGMGPDFTDLYAYISGRFRLFKLHGSVDWGRQVVERPLDMSSPWQAVNAVIRGGREITLSDRFWRSTDRPIWNLDGVPAAPAIAIPLIRKQAFELPADHLENLVRELPNVTEAVFIGWKGADLPFLELMAEARIKPRALVVSGSRPEQAAENIERSAGFQAQAMAGGFSQFVVTRALVPFLEGKPLGPQSRRIDG